MLVSFVGAALAGFAASASAEQSEISVVLLSTAHHRLSYFDLNASAGARVLAGSIEIRNPGHRGVGVTVNAVNGETLSTLGSTYAQPGKKRTGTAAWLSLPTSRLTLAPLTAVRIPVYVQVPRRVRAGDYLGGVSVEQLGQGRTSSVHGVSIASASRYALGVEVQVPGPRYPRIVFTGAQLRREPAGLTFSLLASNTGNVILKGVHGEVTVKRGRHTVLSRTIDSGTFVSGTRIAYPVNAFSEHPSAGTRYAVSAWLRYPGGVARLNTSVTFGRMDAAIQARYRKAAPSRGGTAWWKIAGVIGVILYSLFTTGLLLRRKRRRPLAAPAGGGS